MRSRQGSYAPFIGAAVVTFIVGLAIGGTPGNDETVLNTVSAVLLTVGAIAFVATMVLELLRRRKLAS